MKCYLHPHHVRVIQADDDIVVWGEEESKERKESKEDHVF